MSSYTYSIGINSYSGSIYKLSSITPITPTIIHTFEDFASGSTNGSDPRGQIIIINNYIYGVTNHGGVSQKGVLYKINISNNAYTVVAYFSSVINPTGLIYDGFNTLYIACGNGIATYNNNTSVFNQFEFNQNIGTVVNSFILSNDGTKLYGTSINNGTNTARYIFSVFVNNLSATPNIIYQFGSSIYYPNQIILSPDGNTIYGSIYSSNSGSLIYSLINENNYTSLYTNTDSTNLVGTLILYNNILYGIGYTNLAASTYFYSLNIDGSNFNKLYTFTSGNYTSNIYSNSNASNIIYNVNFTTIGYYTIDPSCFNQNARILCLDIDLKEKYISIKKIKKGTLVKTYKHGFRRVDLIGKKTMRNDPSSIFNCMYCLKSNDPEMPDLIVTGLHGICEDNISESEHSKFKEYGIEIMKINDKYLVQACVSDKFEKIKNRNIYTYYHLTLEHENNENAQYAIMANGILTETTCENNFKRTGFMLTN